MPETQKESMASPPSQPPEAGALFQVLMDRKDDPGQVYTAIREVETMAGQSVVTQLTALIQTTAAKQNAQFQTANARLDSVEKQLGRIWMFLVLILGTLLGTLTTLLTTLLPKG